MQSQCWRRLPWRSLKAAKYLFTSWSDSFTLFILSNHIEHKLPTDWQTQSLTNGHFFKWQMMVFQLIKQSFVATCPIFLLRFIHKVIVIIIVIWCTVQTVCSGSNEINAFLFSKNQKPIFLKSLKPACLLGLTQMLRSFSHCHGNWRLKRYSNASCFVLFF